jgi:hypothetical protein
MNQHAPVAQTTDPGILGSGRTLARAGRVMER